MNTICIVQEKENKFNKKTKIKQFIFYKNDSSCIYTMFQVFQFLPCQTFHSEERSRQGVGGDGTRLSRWNSQEHIEESLEDT